MNTLGITADRPPACACRWAAYVSAAERNQNARVFGAVRTGYIAKNLLLNALAPAVRPLRSQRGSLGMDGDSDKVERTIRRLSPGLEALGGLIDRDVLELGPGRTPELLQRLLAQGARSGTGIDPELVIRDGAPARFLRFDGRSIPLPADSVDLIVSKSALEHVDPRHVEPLVAEMRRVLRTGGGMVHIIDLRDHMFIDGDDEVVGDWLDALRYPEALFRVMFGNRSTGINRLRAPEWRDVFVRHDFDILDWDVRHFPLPIDFEPAHLQPRWRDLPPAILSIGYVTVTTRIAGVPVAARPARPSRVA